jgi:arabinose-5-phosphate isomerase
MSNKGLGMTAIVSDNDELIGIFTDGDLRRVFDTTVDIHRTVIAECMTESCKTGHPNMLAATALELMEEYKINALLIVDDEQQLVGAINMHDLLRAGVV